MPTQQEFNSEFNQSTNYQNMPAPSTISHSSNLRYPQMGNPYQPPMVNASSQNNLGQIPSTHKYTPMVSEAVSTSDANLLLGLGSPFTNPNSLPSPGAAVKFEKDMTSQQSNNRPTSGYPFQSTSLGHPGMSSHGQNMDNQHIFNSGLNLHGAEMMIESQDIDMNTLQNTDAFPFSINGDLIPHLEYLPQDVLSYLADHQTYDPMMNENGPNNP